MVTVTNKDRFGNTLTTDEMIRKFKKKVQQDGILQELSKREYYQSKSVKKRLKRAAHQRLMRKYEN